MYLKFKIYKSTILLTKFILVHVRTFLLQFAHSDITASTVLNHANSRAMEKIVREHANAT